MKKDEAQNLETIFKAIPHMTDFEKERILRVAEEMERQKSHNSFSKADDSAGKHTFDNKPASAFD